MQQDFLNYIEREFYGFAVLAFFEDHPGARLDDLLIAELGMSEGELQTGIEFLTQYSQGDFLDGIL